jgi:hypothetical protein
MLEEQETMANEHSLRPMLDARAKGLDEAERIWRKQAAEEEETEYQNQRAELERRINAEDDARRDEALAEESKAKAALAELERIHAEKKRKEEEVRILRKVELTKLEEEKKKVDEAKRKEKEAEQAITASSPTRRGHFDEAKMLEEQETMAEDLLQRFRLAPEAEGLDEAERIKRLKDVDEAITAYKAVETERIEKERQESEAREAELQRLLKERLLASGLNEEQIKSILRMEKIKKEKEKEAEDNDNDNRPTYTRMSLKYLEMETLLFYKLDFERDEVSLESYPIPWRYVLIFRSARTPTMFSLSAGCPNGNRQCCGTIHASSASPAREDAALAGCSAAKPKQERLSYQNRRPGSWTIP